ncbi:C6 zinc finger domain protein [Aspergillus bertholletiae]|uniref:C6 zinc finger domain protein n=1 Tax=Aspergillus bertholletiae TaxID=1226010 RepID=A0A5N7ATA9_9EURO|nr:C6 zinc finger domain protein [Aspergillus bertholletiae]
MPSRRAHQKSRLGCVGCKRRRVKCDELQPKCSNCLRRHSQCEYDSAFPILWVPGAAPPQQSMAANATRLHQSSVSVATEDRDLVLPRKCNSLNAAATPPGSLNLIDLELLMHWRDTTYEIFCRNSHTRDIWQSLVPQEALKEPFLMHGVLALSAVHLARTRNKDPMSLYINTAVSHQNQALALFRPSLDNINESNARAMFAFASIVTVYSIAFPQAPGSLDPQRAIDDLCQVIVFARGVQQILVKAADYLQDSIFKPLLQWGDLEKRLPEEAHVAFKNLCEVIHDLGADNARYSYLATIDCIQDSLAEVCGGFGAVAAATKVAIRMPPTFILLVRQYDPLALVILGYYCTVLHRLRHNWCIEDKGAQIARAVWSILAEQWKHLMYWVMQDIFGPHFLTRLGTE